MRKIYLSIFLITNILSVFSQEQSALLSRYRKMSLAYNYDLKMAERNILISMEYEKMSRADLKPKLAGEADFQYTGNPMELNMNSPSFVSPIQFKGQSLNYGASISLLQPIYTGGRVMESIRKATYEQSLAAAGADVVRSAVCYQTDIQYWNTVARNEMVTIATDLRNAMARLVATIKDRVSVGLVDPQDLLMAEVKLNEAEYQLLQAKNSFETGRMALNSIIGVGLHSETEIDPVIPPVIFNDSLFFAAGEERAELKMAQEKIKIAESVVRLNDAKYKPQLFIGAGASYSSPGYNFKADMDPNYAVYTKLSIPIFEWGKRHSEKRASLQQVGVATDQLNKVKDALSIEVETARISLDQAMQQVKLSLSSLGKAEENEYKAMERYKEGKISILEVIDAQYYRQTAQINYTQAKVSAHGHYSELIKSLNYYDFE